jgi:hypothetical protein
LEQTEYQKARVREEFATRRKRQLIVTIPIVLLLIGSVLLGERTENTAYPLVLIGVVLVTLVFSFRNWRCPACDGYLGRGINPKFCSKCGAQLRQ